ncbi:MAG: hypothetical protein HQ511_12755 [Rhodospirillales bacterium]|nr:hypothetical protein [Rhodospirillales bacterium]
MSVKRYDCESDAQADLEILLSTDFHLAGNVEIESAAFTGRRLRPDLVAIPRDKSYSDFLIGFEVKAGCPNKTGDYASHLKQAADYVLGEIVDARLFGENKERFFARTIQAAFLFPSYDETYFDSRKEKLLRLYGMHQLSAKFKVGRATFVNGALALIMGAGANPVWIQGRGWRPHARGLVRGKRQIGSQRINLRI